MAQAMLDFREIFQLAITRKWFIFASMILVITIGLFYMTFFSYPLSEVKIFIAKSEGPLYEFNIDSRLETITQAITIVDERIVVRTHGVSTLILSNLAKTELRKSIILEYGSEKSVPYFLISAKGHDFSKHEEQLTEALNYVISELDRLRLDNAQLILAERKRIAQENLNLLESELESLKYYFENYETPEIQEAALPEIAKYSLLVAQHRFYLERVDKYVLEDVSVQYPLNYTTEWQLVRTTEISFLRVLVLGLAGVALGILGVICYEYVTKSTRNAGA